MTRASVLFTSAGSLVVSAILNSLAGRRQHLRLTGVNSTPCPEAEDRLDALRRVPPSSSPEFADALADVVAREAPDLIIPGRDDDVVVLTALAEAGVIDPGKLLAGSHEVALTLRDTGNCAAFASMHDLAFVTTVLTGLSSTHEQIARLMDTTAGPWVIKPRRGQGSRGVMLTWSEPDLLSQAQRPDLVIQPFLGHGPRPPTASGMFPLTSLGTRHDIDAQVVLGPSADVLGMATFTSEMSEGKVRSVEPLHDDNAQELAETYANILARVGWRGPVNVQTARDIDGSIKAFEVNPRFGGGTWARRCAGFDEVGMVVESFLGRELVED